MGRPFKCPFCGESDNVGKGFRRTKSMGKRQIRRCKACGRRFTPKHQAGEDIGVPEQVPQSLAA